MTTFCAIATGIDDGRVTRIVSSSGVVKENEGVLRTRQILELLCELQQPSHELVVFGLNHQANHWLKDIPSDYLRELWATGWIIWGDWRIEWTPGKLFKIRRLDGNGWATVQEVFGFFDTSLAKALETYGMPALKPGDLYGETAALEQLMCCQVADACHDVQATPWPHNWVGAGGIAGTLLRGSPVKEHHTHDENLGDASAHEAIMRGYLAARTELFRQGPATGVQTYDLRSAYPAAMLHLPSLRNARLVPRRRYDPAVVHGLWRVRWHHVRGEIMPLPVRANRAYHWAATGEGIYHAVEVAACLKAGYPLEVQGGWQLKTPHPEHPFRFIEALYRRRQQLERAGDPAANVLKKGLAAIYGKLAQGYGRRGLPRWQSYYWAGELTARVRAQLLPVLLSADRPVMVATDGVFAARARARPAARLGGWKTGRLDWMFAVQPGFYQAFRGDEEVLRAAGFFRNEIDYHAVFDSWQADGLDMVYTYPSRRFIGLGISLQRQNLKLWRQWVNEKQRIFAHQHRKDPEWDADSQAYVLHPHATAPGPSEPYVRKERLLDSRDDDNEMGFDQPLKTTI
jgi:hypothetical protein